MRAAQRGHPQDQCGYKTFQVQQDFTYWEIGAYTFTDTNYNLVSMICTFPHDSITHIEHVAGWTVAGNEPTVDQVHEYGVLLSDEADTPLIGSNFNDRLIWADLRSYIVGGTPAAFAIDAGTAFELFVDDLFYPSQKYGREGLAFYARSTSASGSPITYWKIRVDGTHFINQKTMADNYFKDKQKIDEGWAGYEWEESAASDADFY